MREEKELRAGERGEEEEEKKKREREQVHT